jgi:soluble cytochrome b562
VQHEAEYQLLIVNHEMALQLLKDRDKQDNLYRHSVEQLINDIDNNLKLAQRGGKGLKSSNQHLHESKEHNS